MATITQQRKGFDPSAKAKAIRKGKRFASREGVQHLIRMNKRFSDRLGSQFAAALTYFSFLALVPILMVAFSVVGFILANNQDVLDRLKTSISEQIPGGAGVGDIVNKVLDTAVDQRLSVGIIGLVIALYSGVSWMTNLREALEAVWRPTWEEDPAQEDSFVLATVKDLGRLIGLGLALAVTIGITAVGTNVQTQVLELLGLDDWTWLTPVVSVVTILIAMAADVLIFLWVYKTLPGKTYQVTRKALIRGAVVAAVLFEVLKVLLTVILPQVTGSASGAVFGPIIGLLFFFNLVARMVLMVGAWIATAPGGPRAEHSDHEVPEAQVLIRPSVTRPRVAGLVGAGAIAGWGAARRRRP